MELEKTTLVQTFKIDNLSNKKADIVERIDTKDGHASYDLGKIFTPRGQP